MKYFGKSTKKISSNIYSTYYCLFFSFCYTLFYHIEKISAKEQWKIFWQIRISFGSYRIQYGVWDIYRKKYNWHVNTEIDGYQLLNISFKMFNGEEETIFNEKITEPIKDNRKIQTGRPPILL